MRRGYRLQLARADGCPSKVGIVGIHCCAKESGVEGENVFNILNSQKAHMQWPWSQLYKRLEKLICNFFNTRKKQNLIIEN